VSAYTEPWSPSALSFEPTPRYAALVSDINQAAEDGLVSAETAWALVDDLDLDAWYDAWARASAASDAQPTDCPFCGGAL
jgi:hypothetical protein